MEATPGHPLPVVHEAKSFGARGCRVRRGRRRFWSEKPLQGTLLSGGRQRAKHHNYSGRNAVGRLRYRGRGAGYASRWTWWQSLQVVAGYAHAEGAVLQLVVPYSHRERGAGYASRWTWSWPSPQIVAGYALQGTHPGWAPRRRRQRWAGMVSIGCGWYLGPS